MRVLIGTDGSEPAERACALAASLDWPRGSTARVVSAYPTIANLVTWPGVTLAPETIDELDAEARADAVANTAAAVRRLERPGLSIQTATALGRPADVILDEAAAFGPDLIMAGHRGLGQFESALLGSVSAELVDRASCPVLVARTPEVRRILVADDGSAYAEAAAELIRRYPVFHRPIVVLSVAEVHPHSPAWIARLEPERAHHVNQAVAASREAHEAQARATAERLRAAGLDTEAVVVDGEPARGIVEAAVSRGVDLIVMGTHGRRGLERLLLGSVARTVLWHAPCSVLIARRDVQQATS